MDIRLDHIVLWVQDPLRSVEFYERVVGLEGLRVAEFKERKVLFPSVRVSGDSIIDLMPLAVAPKLNAKPELSAIPGAESSAGHKVNHVCLALGKADYEQLRARLAAAGVATPVTMRDSFGARGQAPEAIYFGDPDGNVLEARYYE